MADGACAPTTRCPMAARCRDDDASRRARVAVDLRTVAHAATTDESLDTAACCRHIVLLRGGRYDGQDVFVTGEEWACGIYLKDGLRYEAKPLPSRREALRVFVLCSANPRR